MIAATLYQFSLYLICFYTIVYGFARLLCTTLRWVGLCLFFTKRYNLSANAESKFQGCVLSVAECTPVLSSSGCRILYLPQLFSKLVACDYSLPRCSRCLHMYSLGKGSETSLWGTWGSALVVLCFVSLVQKWDYLESFPNSPPPELFPGLWSFKWSGFFPQRLTNALGILQHVFFSGCFRNSPSVLGMPHKGALQCL